MRYRRLIWLYSVLLWFWDSWLKILDLAFYQKWTGSTIGPDENVSQFAAALHDMANKSLGMRGGIENFIKE